MYFFRKRFTVIPFSAENIKIRNSCPCWAFCIIWTKSLISLHISTNSPNGRSCTVGFLISLCGSYNIVRGSS